MSNWHIKIADCNEAQKERLKEVYGFTAIKAPFFGMKDECTYEWVSPRGELITPEQAFEQLGLDVADNDQSYALKYDLHDAEQKIKELEQQLADKPDLQGVDWSNIELKYNWLAQNKGSGTIDFYSVKPTGSNYVILATRPKPKYTPEQIEAVKDFDAWVSRRHKLSGEFNWWLKEVSDE